MIYADGKAGDTSLRIFTQNTMPLCLSGLFFHNLWETCLPPRPLLGILQHHFVHAKTLLPAFCMNGGLPSNINIGIQEKRYTAHRIFYAMSSLFSKKPLFLVSLKFLMMRASVLFFFLNTTLSTDYLCVRTHRIENAIESPSQAELVFEFAREAFSLLTIRQRHTHETQTFTHSTVSPAHLRYLPGPGHACRKSYSFWKHIYA